MGLCRDTKHTKGGNFFQPTHKIILFSLGPLKCILDLTRTLVLHSLTVQSKEEVTNRWEKSSGPGAVWQWIPVMGPWWPSNISLMPALLWSTWMKCGVSKQTDWQVKSSVTDFISRSSRRWVMLNIHFYYCMKGTDDGNPKSSQLTLLFLNHSGITLSIKESRTYSH